MPAPATSLITGMTRAFMPTATFGSAAAATMQSSRWILPPPQKDRVEAILSFWFGGAEGRDNGWRADPPQITPNYELWFGGSPETDATIKAKFGDDVQKAKEGQYNKWAAAGPMECLALIILLDQFALNVFRDLPEGYLCSESAIPLSYAAIARGYPKSVPSPSASADSASVGLPHSMRMFFYLPLMHSELLQDQEECVRQYTEMADEDPTDTERGALSFAVLHRDIVAKYGRFPGRNRCMGRDSTADELKYLEEGGVF